MNKASMPIIVQPGTGKVLHAFGGAVSVMLAGEQTGGALTVLSGLTPPGGGPPLHRHHNEDEIFLVIEGQMSYFVDGRWTEVGVGGAVYLPKDTAHTFRNVGSSPSRHWIITTPSGFEIFFAHCADEFAKPSGPDMNRIVEIHKEHNIELIDEHKD
jgi:mannose-6-phosphate isomerase-like protein (cupin superfamily)